MASPVNSYRLPTCLSLILRLINDMKIYRFPVFNFIMHNVYSTDVSRRNELEFRLPNVRIDFPYPRSHSDGTYKMSIQRAFWVSDIYNTTMFMVRVPRYNFLMLSSGYRSASFNYHTIAFKISVIQE